MSRKRTPPKVHEYYRAVQEIFAKQSEILTAVLPHFGERGRNDEERVRDLLLRVLPKKLSLGTGFVVCSDPSISASAQTDIVIYDEQQNSPLHRELSAYVYPADVHACGWTFDYAVLRIVGGQRSGIEARVTVLQTCEYRRDSVGGHWHAYAILTDAAPGRPKPLYARRA